VGNLTNATAIGVGALVNASHKIRLGNLQVNVIEGQLAYTFSSDKDQKEDFQPVEGEEVLSRHYGPVAQDFFGAFGHDAIGTIGTSTTINSGHMDGILMVAVQALEKRTVALAQEKATFAETVEALKAENADLKARLKALERAIGSDALSRVIEAIAVCIDTPPAAQLR
jgi:hypothetical protein